MTNSHNAPSNEQIKKDLKKDAENIEKKAEVELENAKEQGAAKAKDLKKQGSAKAQELKKQGEFEAEALKESGKELYEAASERGQQIYDDASKRGEEAFEAAKKEFNHLEKEGKNLWQQFWSWFQTKSSEAGKYVQQSASQIQKASGNAVSRVGIELQNPVVVAQLVVAAGGAAAGYLGYLERHRIRSDNNAVVGIHASIVTGLVLLDGFLFNKYYPQYDKKRTTVA